MDDERLKQAQQRLEQAKQRIKQTLKSNPELKQAFKEALDNTYKHFQKPEVIAEITTNINKIKNAFESGKFKEVVQAFKEENKLTDNAKLTDELRKELANKLATEILGKK